MDKPTELDPTTWFSTYGILTSSRILGQFQIQLSNEELLPAIKQLSSVYHQLLAIPVKHVLNGIIYQQAYDYQVYAQKLFVDYLLSGEQSKDPESPGGATREQLEQLRQELTQMNESFSEKQAHHEKLISQSQASLIKCAAELQRTLQSMLIQVRTILVAENINKEDALIKHALRLLMIHFEHLDHNTLTSNASIWTNLSTNLQVNLNDAAKQKLVNVLDALDDPKNDIDNIVLTYSEPTEEIGLSFRNFRSQFYNLILNITEALNMLSDYHVDEQQVKDNRESLYFDAHLGDDLGKETVQK